MNAANELEEIFEQNSDKRVCVVGTTCSGKSTFNKKFINSLDMDQIVFSHLTPNEISSVDDVAWDEEVGKKMEKLAKRHVEVIPGRPVFGTVPFDCDVLVYLDIDEKLLKDRCKMRGVSYKDAQKMDKFIYSQFNASNAKKIVVKVDSNIEAKSESKVTSVG